MAPPRIVSVALGKQSECIDEAGVDEGLKSRALLIGETLLAAIGLGIRKIEFGMGNIEVTAKYDGLGFFQLFAICEEGRIPMLVPQGEPAQVVLGIRRINGDH